jgi:hypothetical protein
MLDQLRVYKNKVHVANCPARSVMYWWTTTGCPIAAVELMRKFIKGEIATTRYGEWSWEWMQLPK